MYAKGQCEKMKFLVGLWSLAPKTKRQQPQQKTQMELFTGDGVCSKLQTESFWFARFPFLCEVGGLRLGKCEIFPIINTTTNVTDKLADNPINEFALDVAIYSEIFLYFPAITECD